MMHAPQTGLQFAKESCERPESPFRTVDITDGNPLRVVNLAPKRRPTRRDRAVDSGCGASRDATRRSPQWRASPIRHQFLWKELPVPLQDADFAAGAAWSEK